MVVQCSHAFHGRFGFPETDETWVIRTIYHAAGTAAMGKVVTNDLRAIGVERFRIVDASVIPLPISGDYQACVYALAEQAAEIIAGDHGG